MKLQTALAQCGGNFRRLREQRRISVDALATLSGIDDRTIRQFEQGKGGDVAIIDLLRIAEVLDIELSDILNVDDFK